MSSMSRLKQRSRVFQLDESVAKPPVRSDCDRKLSFHTWDSLASTHWEDVQFEVSRINLL